MSQPGCMDQLLCHHVLSTRYLSLLQEPHCGGKIPRFYRHFFFSPMHKQHNYSTATAWFTEWNLFCSVLRGRLLFLPLLQLKQPKNLQFPTITVVSKVNVWIFCWSNTRMNKHVRLWCPITDNIRLQPARSQWLNSSMLNEVKLIWNKIFFESSCDFTTNIELLFSLFTKYKWYQKPFKHILEMIKVHFQWLKTRRRRYDHTVNWTALKIRGPMEWIIVELALRVHAQNYSFWYCVCSVLLTLHPGSFWAWLANWRVFSEQRANVLKWFAQVEEEMWNAFIYVLYIVVVFFFLTYFCSSLLAKLSKRGINQGSYICLLRGCVSVCLSWGFRIWASDQLLALA